DLRAVGREPEFPYDESTRGERCDLLGEVVKDPGAHLAYPEIELALAIRQKRDEFSVRGDLGTFFATLPVRERCESSVGKRVLRADRRSRRFPSDDSDCQSADCQPRQPGPTRSGGGTTGVGQFRNDLADRLDLDPRVADVLQTPLRILREASVQQSSNGWRRLDRKTRPVRVVLDHGRQQIRQRLTVEGWRPGEHLEQHTRTAPDVVAT